MRFLEWLDRYIASNPHCWCADEMAWPPAAMQDFTDCVQPADAAATRPQDTPTLQ